MRTTRSGVTAVVLAAAGLVDAGAARAQDGCADPLFGTEIQLAGESNYAWAVYDADLDGDGDADVLSASSGDDKIAWYPTEGGAPGLQKVITSELDVADGVSAADLDGDGDLDVLGTSGSAGKIAWYEQVAVGEFGPARAVTNLAGDVTSIFPVDLDGDGDIDVLSSSYSLHRIAWWANDGTGDFGALKVITPFADYATCALAADFDGDGDPDVLWSEAGDDTIAWMPNDGRGHFGPEQDIDVMAEIAGPYWVDAGDLDGDGDLDVVAAMSGENHVAWYENLDGSGGFGAAQNITTAANWVRCVVAADLDGDGDADVLSAAYSGDQVAWYENTDGLGAFGPQQVITAAADGTRSVRASDIDGDGSRDVIVASPFDHTLAWFANVDGQGGFGPEQAITTTVLGAYDVAAADIDGDGDLDALTASAGDDKIAWYENLDGAGLLGVQQIVTTSADYARAVVPADFDGDGDVDLLSASFGDKTVAWYRNLDGLGSFGPKQVITSAAPGSYALVADLDGDGDLDVATSVSPNPAKPAVFANLDGQGTFGPPQIIASPVAQTVGLVEVADMDGDGDEDLLRVHFTFPSGTLQWLENSGSGVFGTAHTVAQPLAGGVVARAADVDGDGDLDMLVGTNNDDRIAWYENVDGLGGFGPEKLISTTADGPRDLEPADVDGDGDLDVLSAAWIGNNEIGWFENLDGQGVFGGQQVITDSPYEGIAVAAADLTGDGQRDILFAAVGNSRAAWISVRPMLPALTPIGAPLPGTLGAPALAGSSCLSASAWLELTLTKALPLSTTFLVMGLSQLDAPLKGGVLVPFPNFVVPLPTDSHGMQSLAMPLPANVPPGVPVFFQHWIIDPGGPKGFAASNGLTGTTQ